MVIVIIPTIFYYEKANIILWTYNIIKTEYIKRYKTYIWFKMITTKTPVSRESNERKKLELATKQSYTMNMQSVSIFQNDELEYNKIGKI